MALGDFFFLLKFYVMLFSCHLYVVYFVLLQPADYYQPEATCMYIAAIRFQRSSYDYVAHIPSELDAAVLSMGVEIKRVGARSNRRFREHEGFRG